MNKSNEIQQIEVDKLIQYVNNSRTHSDEQIKQIQASLREFGFINPVLVDKENTIIAGHGRVMAAKAEGIKEVPCIKVEHLSEAQKKAYIIADNRLAELAGWDYSILEAEIEALKEADFNIDFTGFTLDDFMTGAESLKEPFNLITSTILDARQYEWQERKRAWKSLGIRSEEGRDAECLPTQLGGKYGRKDISGTSIFDPTLCELIYKWYSPAGGSVYDSFAGGSVRGIVAEQMGRSYTGIDLRAEQIDANNRNAKEIGIFPTWHADDSMNADKYLNDASVDLFFSCPPYADLEVYSDDERDISNMEYPEFLAIYKEIIKIGCRKLKEDRFAVFVVGDIRDKKGFYRNFIDDTKNAFADAGMIAHDELYLLEALTTAPLRAPKAFNASRKVTKTHQNVLVFYKGDELKIKDNYKL